MGVVELEKCMPDGWRLGQIEAQPPTISYAEFKREILNGITRCLNLPFNIAAGNSVGYNDASGRLDHNPRQEVGHTITYDFFRTK